jgi:hypothetical protein
MAEFLYNRRSQVMVFFFQKIIIILLKKIFIFLVFFYLRGCPGQFACTTTNPTAH